MDLPNLTDVEMNWCRQQAAKAERNGRGLKQNISYYSGLASMENREISYRAEFSVAKFFGLASPNDHTTFDGPDVGHWLQVRLNRRGPDMLVPEKRNPKKRDPRSYAYLLVVPWNNLFRMVGWLGGEKVFDRLPAIFRQGDTATYRVLPEELSIDWDLLRLIARSGPI